MSKKNIVANVMGNLEHNRKDIENALVVNQRNLKILQKQISENDQRLFGWVKNLFLRNEEKKLLNVIDKDSKKVAKYKEAERGLKNNNYESAINLLSEVVSDLADSSFWDTGFMFGPRAMATEVLKLRNELISLTNKPHYP